jgi:hypothetical protein
MSTLLTTADFVAAVAAAPYAPTGVTYQAVPALKGTGAVDISAPDAFTILRTQNGVTTTRWNKVYFHSGRGYGPNDANPNGSGVEIRGLDSYKATSDAAAFLKTLI